MKTLLNISVIPELTLVIHTTPTVNLKPGPNPT